MPDPVLITTARWNEPAPVGIDRYVETGGYEGLRAALAMAPEDVIEEVKRSGLRGRGGAGFPTGTKWSFIPQDMGKPIYVVCNADESEPGTFNNRELIERDPHQLIEGIAICSYAVRCRTAFIYCRGEFVWPAMVLEDALRDAYGRGYLGSDVMGSGYALDVVLHRASGAYICGEETALLNSLEGLRGQPRLRPPFPAVEGLYASPTVINNVETLSNVPHIMAKGAEWFASIGTEKSTGTAIYSVSGKVERPGNYEAPMGTTARVLIEEHAGGVLGGRALKAWTPGGSSTPLLTADHLDTPMDFESVVAAGSLLGTKAMMVFDETDCIVAATLRFSRFYAHESCGKCTNCREGTWWLERVLRRIEAGVARGRDIDLAKDIGGNMLFKAFCALADGAVSPVDSSIRYFRDEYEEHLRLGRCPFVPAPAPAAAGAPPATATDAEPEPLPADGRGVRLDEVLG